MPRTQQRIYQYHGIHGCVKRSRSRTTGQSVTLYVATQAGIPADHPWVVVCETHNTQASYATFRQAQQHLPRGDWCAACRAAPPHRVSHPHLISTRTSTRGRRIHRSIMVQGHAVITFGHELTSYLGNPLWVAVQWTGRDVVVTRAEEPSSTSPCGIHRVTRWSNTRSSITAMRLIHTYQIANGRYIPRVEEATVRFTPDRRTSEMRTDDAELSGSVDTLDRSGQ